jgi:hypothetical protein
LFRECFFEESFPVVVICMFRLEGIIFFEYVREEDEKEVFI